MSDGTSGATPIQRARSRLAQNYAARGWYVLPTRARVPVIKDWENECTVDPDEARAAWSRGGEWSRFNVAIACGPSGLVVIDLDTKGGKDGPGELARLLAEHQITLPRTYSIRTPSGGIHRYFKAPPGAQIRLSASQIADGVDIRAWGGLVVAAGSEIDGKTYEVIDDAPVADLPPGLVRVLLNPTGGSSEKRAERLPAAIPQGERDSMLTSLAGTMRRRGASSSAILAALQVENTDRCNPPLPDEDLERIAGSVARYDPADPPPALDDEIEVDPDLLSKQLVTLETTRVATEMMKARAMRRQREILGGMGEPVNVLDFVAAGPDPVATCIWGVPQPGGIMAWAQNQGVIIAGPPGTGKSTIALQVILRRVGILDGPVLGLPVRVDESNLVYMALDRADQIRQSIRRMVPADADPAAIRRLLMIDNIPPQVDLREVSTFITWLQTMRAGGVVIDSAKDLGFDLNDSSEGQAFNFLVQATLRAGIQIFVTHHSRKTPRGDKKPLTLNDMHGSQWVAAGAGSVIMLDGMAGPDPKRMVHVKPLTVPMAPLLLELDPSTGEVSHREDDTSEGEDDPKPRRGGLQDQILALLASQSGPLTGAEITSELGAHSGSVSRALGVLRGKMLVENSDEGWETTSRIGMTG